MKKDVQERLQREVAEVTANESSVNPKVRVCSFISDEALIQHGIKEANIQASCFEYIHVVAVVAVYKLCYT